MKVTTCTAFAIRVATFYLILAGLCQSVHAQSDVRFRLVHDTVIVVSLMANDQGPFDFVLDTGTNSTVVDPQVARRLSLAAQDHIQLITVSREMTVERTSIRILSMGSANATDVEVLVEDLSELRKVDSRLVGLLGQNFLGQFNYLIDYTRHSIRIEQGDELERAIDGNRTPVEMSEGMMLVPSELQSKNQAKLRLLLDSGANYLSLFRTASLNLEEAPPANHWKLNTGSGENGVKTTVLKSLTVGAERFSNITVALPNAPAGKERAADGSLPVAIFHSIYINNQERFVIFNAEPKSRFKQ